MSLFLREVDLGIDLVPTNIISIGLHSELTTQGHVTPSSCQSADPPSNEEAEQDGAGNRSAGSASVFAGAGLAVARPLTFGRKFPR